MPASICDPVSSALRLSLAADDSQNSSLLESKIYSSAKSVLLSKIEFEESGDYQSNVLDGLKSKYVVIRHKKPGLENKFTKKDGTNCSQTQDEREDGVPKAKRVLFPIERVQLGWRGAWAAGAGMHNVGNTCYLNSTLQALFHVPALANWLVSEAAHFEKCNQQEPCVICCMRATLMATQKCGGAPIKPWQVYSKLRQICRHLTPGRQEDAHEFLRYLVEAMEKSYLSRFGNADKLDQYSKETTPLNQILGGYLRSTVRCLSCHHLSTTYQHFQDLLLDIRKHSTLDEALDSFFSRERLEDLGYKCEACNKKVSATKQFFIERAPMVLCIALKRFSLAGGKLSKHIQFRKKISLSKYFLSKNINSAQHLSYKLVSLVTHLGPSQHCGHYTALGQAAGGAGGGGGAGGAGGAGGGTYYQFDDSCVRPLPLSAVLATNAYIMFYEREAPPPPPAAPAEPAHPPAAARPSPLKLTFYRSDEKKPHLDTNGTKDPRTEAKPPIILNRTLTNTSETNSEPWVLKQNGEVEKVFKVVNGSEKKPDMGKVSFVIKRSTDENNLKNETNDSKFKKKPIIESIIRNGASVAQKTPEKCMTTSKLVKPPKSPLEKLEEQMNNNKNGEMENHSHKNGNGVISRLVPYDSESSGDERSGRGAPPGWTVSRERCGPLLSPSLNGVANIKKLNEKSQSPEAARGSPATSVSSLSPLSDGPVDTLEKKERVAVAAAAAAAAAEAGSGRLLATSATARVLAAHSHRGYGAPVAAWSGAHSHMDRQVFEERRAERKRALEAAGDEDRGRAPKAARRYHPRPRPRHQYNPFQERQNKQNWGGGFKYRHERRPPHHFHNKHYNNKYKRFNNNRYNNSSGHHYARQH